MESNLREIFEPSCRFHSFGPNFTQLELDFLRDWLLCMKFYIAAPNFIWNDKDVHDEVYGVKDTR